jgi:MFS family permease
MTDRAPSSPPPSAHVLAALTFLAVTPVTMLVPVLKSLVQDTYGLDAAATSDFMAVNMVGAVLAAPLAGFLQARFAHPRDSIAAAFLCDAALLMALRFARGEVSYPLYLGIRFFEGAAHILALSMVLGLAARCGRDAASRGRVMGAMGAALTFGVALGAPLGGKIGDRAPDLVFTIGASLSLLAGIVAALRLGRAQAAERHRGLFSAVRALREDARLFVPYAFTFTDRFTVGFFISAFPLYLGNVLQRSPGQIGAALAAFLLPFAALCYPVGRLSARVSRTTFMAVGSAVYGVSCCLVGHVSEGALIPLMVVLGLASSVMFVPTLMLASVLGGESDRTTVMGGFNAAGSLGFLCGPLVAGRVVTYVSQSQGEASGYAAAFVVAGIAEMLCVGLALPFLKRLERAEVGTKP